MRKPGFVKVKLTYINGYSRVIEMSIYTYEHYVKDRNLLTNENYHSINWVSEDGKVAVSFKDLVVMEIIGGII